MDLVVQASDELRGLAASGDLLPLACASAQRMPAFPQVPTLRELGIELVADNMKGWVGPAGMPAEMVASLHDRFRQAMSAPRWQRFMEQTGEADGYANGVIFRAFADDSIGLAPALCASDAEMDEIFARIRKTLDGLLEQADIRAALG